MQVEPLLDSIPRYKMIQQVMIMVGPKGWGSLLADLSGWMLQVGYNIGQADALDMLAGIEKGDLDQDVK